ncbi:transmembrane protein 222 [Sipha flava]|uniref:Transmembrane protein n=1 Tax=Sipha flava TaxID=143950 RepID=A0A2S2QH93_9HEMI|nr:transmembrane protein 222 [Sipha flava]
MDNVNNEYRRYPYCVVWTPIPFISWLFPLIGHMGITTSTGVIRDFSGSFYVAEDDMAFGYPTKYWQLDVKHITGGSKAWDKAVNEASIEYFNRMHNLLCDNCHSHVGMALALMNYNKSKNWNMVKLALYTFIFGKYVSCSAWFKTWGPFIIFVFVCLALYSFGQLI